MLSLLGLLFGLLFVTMCVGFMVIFIIGMSALRYVCIILVIGTLIALAYKLAKRLF